MRIKELVLRNFGVYRGEQTLQLAPRAKLGNSRPIILVGGQNGAGKTTILEAVRLCLYGKLALGGRVSDTEYQSYLRDHIHRNRDALLPISYASVALEFDYAHGGIRSTYLVHRAWETKGETGVTESLRVLRDGKSLADVESQFWPDFVRSLIPPGVSQLFFFDGERIKRLAEEDTEAETLGESVKSLLGLDIVERLQADLDLYNSRYLKKTVTGQLASRVAEIEKAESRLLSDLELMRAAEEALKERVTSLGHEIERSEQNLAQRGEGLSAQRGELRHRKADLELRRDQIEKAMRDLCEGVLPFAICSEICKELRSQLEKETALETWKAGREQVRKALAKASARLVRGKLPKRLGWDSSMRRAVESELSSLATDLCELPSELLGVVKMHTVSESVNGFIRNVIDSAIQDVLREVARLTKELEVTTSSLREVQEYLNRTPEGDTIAPLVKLLSGQQEEHAKASLELTLKAEDRMRCEKEMSILAHERARILKTQEESRGITNRLSLAVSARKALDDYLRRLTTAKIDELERVALECFRALSRKTDLVQKLSINPLTFEVTLFDANAQPLPKALLSAGEKQIYAISLLWSLAKVSGRALPMIIDTPLGRLDSVHRKHLLERYFPAASHQVIILSTDTEVDRTYFGTLNRHMSHSLHLVNQAGGWTEAIPGYFWKAEAVADVGA